MEEKLLLLISKDQNFTSDIEKSAPGFFEVTSVNNLHAAYPLALSHIPDGIVIDQSCIDRATFRTIWAFRSSHFLNKTLLFLVTDKKAFLNVKQDLNEDIDFILSRNLSPGCLLEEINDKLLVKQNNTNYWRDSFMNLFNLLRDPVVLLEEESIVAINDAFKKDFFVSGNCKMGLNDILHDKSLGSIRHAIRKFLKGKHMKASTTAMIKANDKLREARITFSRLDRKMKNQLIMMINFSGNEAGLYPGVGSYSSEVEKYFCSKVKEEQKFTRREKEIISLLCKGYKTKEIAEFLCITPKTIEKHRANIIRRTNSGTILESVVYALNHNMVSI